jgi:uncharacterized membrane protein
MPEVAMDEAECCVCHRRLPPEDLRPLAHVGREVAAALGADVGTLPADGFVCRDDLARYRRAEVERLLEAERGELSALDREVLASLAAGATVAEDVAAAYAGQRTLGERAADAVAGFGGSWAFIAAFCAVLVAWMAVNAVALRAFDPYPFILLNLVLSCVAALQAPIIMMSQRRQEARDRLRAENDYKVNLKAELEIRHLPRS